MTSYTPDALEMFNYDANMILKTFLIKHEDEFKKYADTMARELHGRSPVVSSPDTVVRNYAVNRYAAMIRSCGE